MRAGCEALKRYMMSSATDDSRRIGRIRRCPAQMIKEAAPRRGRVST